MTRRCLPIGIQDFPTIRNEDFYYVDKTSLVRQLVDEGRHYFLSRPRRFGKSLLLDTLGSLFACHEPLFRGLYLVVHRRCIDGCRMGRYFRVGPCRCVSAPCRHPLEPGCSLRFSHRF